jgi:type II secretory pathway predicted ATPase ExeA
MAISAKGGRLIMPPQKSPEPGATVHVIRDLSGSSRVSGIPARGGACRLATGGIGLRLAAPSTGGGYAVEDVEDQGGLARVRMIGQLDIHLDIYTDHFGLSQRPFSLVPDPDFLFWSDLHRRAYAMLEYGLLTHAPITLITGEVGAGKTTLLHYLLRNLGEGIAVGMIANAHGDRGDLLRWILQALSQDTDPKATYVDLFHQFQGLLIEEYARGRRTVLIFDEAQNLSRESLEELRMFTNINANKDELLQLVLVGQPELRDMVRRVDLTQFAQRVSASLHIPAMDARNVAAYIAHRLHVAGASRRIFKDSACLLVHKATGGVPRLVNQLCDLAMVYAFTNNRKLITEAIVQQVLDDGVFFGGGPYILRNPEHES